MRRSLIVALLLLGFGLTVSSCAPGVYTSANVGVGPAYYGPGYYRPYPYYAPRYYGPRYVVPAPPPPVIVRPGPRYYGGYRGGPGWYGPRGGYQGGPRRR